MDYHAQNISEYGFLWMPANGSICRNIEERCLIFKEEPCNVRILLVANGVNPFGEIGSIYLVCPIFFIRNC